MPIYEFHCKECRNEFKTLRRTADATDVACPTCGTSKVARLLSVTAQTQTQSETACSLPSNFGCMGNPSACGCRN